ncbi:MAG: leucine-rich repeat protein [Bacilli bacterium]|nr:leucine-rich repeat protein [Bacilli bacterium]
MTRNKKRCYTFIALLSLLTLTSCGEESSSSVSSWKNPISTTKFDLRYIYSQDAGDDKIYAKLSDEDPQSYDDKIILNNYIWTNKTNIEGYYEDGALTIEDTVRADVTSTPTGDGYPIVSLNTNLLANKTDITSVTMGQYIETINDGVFKGDTSLTSINMEDLKNLNYIGTDVFNDVPWYSTYLQLNAGKVISFGNVIHDVSGSLGNSTYKVPSNIVSISADAFKGHSELTSLDLSEATSLERIGAGAFEGTGITSVVLPSSVTYVGDGAFKDCLNLTTADIAGNEKIELGNAVLENDKLSSLSYDGSVKLSSLIGTKEGILNDLTSVKLTGDKEYKVCSGALNGASNLTTVDLSGTKIIESNVFSGLTQLATIKGIDQIEYVADDSVKDTLWYDNQADGLIYFGTAFICPKGTLTSVALMNDVTGIAAEAFAKSSKISSIPETVKYIGEKAFQQCANITLVSLPNLIFCADRAFQGCNNIETIYFADNAEMGEGIFEFCSNVKYVSLPYSGLLESLFYETPNLIEYNFMEGPSEVYRKMFKDLKTLKKVTFSSTIETIGAQAFRGCSSLKEVNFPSTLYTVGALSFAECTSLSSVTFEYEPGLSDVGNFKFFGVANIYALAFFGCSSLSGTFSLPPSVVYCYGCILSDTNVTLIDVNVLDRYIEITGYADFIENSSRPDFSSDWNSKCTEPDEYGNPSKIDYVITIIPTPEAYQN